MTTVYHYDAFTNHSMILVLSLLIAVLIGVGIRVVIIPIFRGDRDEYGNRISYKEIPLLSKLIFQGIPALIIIIGCLGLGNLLKGYASYEINMMAGNATTWSGDPEFVSSEESWYRDSFMGYDVTLLLDGQEFKPSNNFQMEMVELFQSDAQLTIYYGYMGDELTVWKITTEDNLSN